jgi:hypothetical protein
MPAPSSRGALGEAAAERPGILKQAGLSTLQVWEAVTDGADERPGDQRLAIVFTDLVGFSDWAVEAGDDISLELLRAVAAAIEPPVEEHRGEVVKRLGDGMMAVFDDPDAALTAIFEARRRLNDVEVAGYRPRMRAGMHVGTPRRLAGPATPDGERAPGDERAVALRTPDLMTIPRLLGGALNDLRTIAEGMAVLPQLLSTLHGIQAKVDSLDDEVKRMRSAVDGMGGDVGDGIERLEPHLVDVTRVAHPLRRLGERRRGRAEG